MDIGEALPDENIPFAIHIQAPVIDEFAPDEVDDNNNDVQMAGHNDPLAEDAFAQDALLIGEHPAEATGIEAELPQQIIPPENAPCLRRSTRNPKYTKKMKLYKGLPSSDDDEDANLDMALSAIMLDHDPSKPFTPLSVLTIEPYIPISYKDATTCPESTLWKAAMEDEFQSLMENNTWRIVQLPAERKAIKAKWVLDYKPGYKDVEPRYKARLVACGYAQLFGVDYLDTYAPVVKHYSIRLVLAIVALKDLEMIQLDIKTAFLYGELEEELYLQQPEGYVIPGKENWVCRLLKPLYGLKQASRCWYSKFDDAILQLNFKRCLYDPCVYYRTSPGGEYTILVIYVDDGLVCSNMPGVLTDIVEFLRTHFKVRSLNANRFVGLDITRDRPNRKLFISQPDFIRNILKRYNMHECNPVSIPANPNHRLVPSMSPTSDEERHEMSRIPYRECIGSLMYLMGMTRADIALAVNQASAYVQDPGREHWKGVKQILAYLAKTIHHGICYGGNPNAALLGFTDADFAADLKSRKSTTGVVFLYNGGPVSWGSRRQRATALSTTDAEFYAASEGARESIWIKSLLLELGIDVGQVLIRCDSKCAISLIHDGEHHQRTKHIDVKYFYVRDQQDLGNIAVTHLPGKDQPADMFTKPLPRPAFEKFRELIGIQSAME